MSIPAPSDVEAEAVWDKIMLLAAQAGLIVQAASGVAVLAIPSEQRKAGVRNRVLAACLFAETTR